MIVEKVQLNGPVKFKIRFNNAHGGTNLFWRVIIDAKEYLVNSIDCRVPTHSDASFDIAANAIKFHIAGTCQSFLVDDEDNARFL